MSTTDSQHDLPVAENLLNRQFNPAESNRAWTSDITYIHTRTGWLYLAAVMDLHSRKIIGWAMSPTMPAELVCRALCMAIGQRQPTAGLILHSDRGSHNQWLAVACERQFSQMASCSISTPAMNIRHCLSNMA